MGEVTYGSGKFSFTVAFVDFAPASELLQLWQETIDKASLQMFVALGGQVQLGSLEYKVNAAFDDDSELFIYPSGASITTGADFTDVRIGYVKLNDIEKDRAFMVLHELSHLFFNLFDEYRFANPFYTCPGGVQKCPNCCRNPDETHACIMEHGWTIGQTEGLVTQYCHGTVHDELSPDDDSTDEGPDAVLLSEVRNHYTSGQPSHNELSCWTKIENYYRGEISPPENYPTTTHLDGHETVEWQALTNDLKCLSVFINSANVAAAEAALKNSLSFQARFTAFHGYQFGAVTTGPLDNNLIPLQTMSANSLSDVLRSIADLDLENTGPIDASLNSGLDEINSTPKSAHQIIQLVVPGTVPDQSGSGGLSILGIGMIDVNLNRIKLNVDSLGEGPLADGFVTLGRKERFINTQLSAGGIDDDSELVIQSRQVQLVVQEQEGVSMVNVIAGALTDWTVNDFPAHDDFVENLPLNYEFRGEGFDFPVYIEEQTRVADFLLSTMQAGSIILALYNPLGERVRSELESNDAISWIHVPTADIMPGRWMMRVQRLNGNQRIPFQLMAFAENPNVHFSARVEQSEPGNVSIHASATFGQKLVNLTPLVEIFRSENGSHNLSDRVAFTVLVPTTRTPSNSDEPIEIAFGNYVARIELDAGTYTAIVKVQNGGSATVSSNSIEELDGNLIQHMVAPAVPPFLRTQRFQFIVE